MMKKILIAASCLLLFTVPAFSKHTKHPHPSKYKSIELRVNKLENNAKSYVGTISLLQKQITMMQIQLNELKVISTHSKG